MFATRAQYAIWWEAHEMVGARETEAAMRLGCDTHGDPDDTNGESGERDIAMDSDESLAVLRYMAANEDEAAAYERVAGELVELRAQRQAALELATEWERGAWDRGGDHKVRASVRELRDALGLVR